MSKFRQLIRDTGKAPAGFGFAAPSKRAKTRHILILAEVEDAAAAAGAVEAGVDGIMYIGAAAEVGAVQAGVRPTGVWLEDADRASVQAARDAGADFFVFDDMRAHASSLAVDEIGRVLVLGADQNEERLRSIAGIDLDAVLMAADPEALTVHDILSLRRVVGYTGAPLLVASVQAPSAAALEAWRDAGAAAVLVRGDATALRAAVEAAEAVPPPRKRRNEGVTPSLGLRVAAPTEHDHDDDDF